MLAHPHGGEKMARETYTRFTGPVIGAPISTTLSDDTPANSTSISFRAPSDGRFLFVGGFTHTGSGDFTLKVNDVAAASAITVDTDGGYTETFTTTSFSKYDKISGWREHRDLLEAHGHSG